MGLRNRKQWCQEHGDAVFPAQSPYPPLPAHTQNRIRAGMEAGEDWSDRRWSGRKGDGLKKARASVWEARKIFKSWLGVSDVGRFHTLTHRFPFLQFLWHHHPLFLEEIEEGFFCVYCPMMSSTSLQGTKMPLHPEPQPPTPGPGHSQLLLMHSWT